MEYTQGRCLLSKSYKLSNGVRNSSVKLSKRTKKYSNIGGPRQYPSKWCWELIGNAIHCVEVRYFSQQKGYHFFKYANGVTTRGAKVPKDRILYNNPIDCYNNKPVNIHPLRERYDND